MASRGNRHCASCVGTLSFPIRLASLRESGCLLGGVDDASGRLAEFRCDSTEHSLQRRSQLSLPVLSSGGRAPAAAHQCSVAFERPDRLAGHHRRPCAVQVGHFYRQNVALARVDTVLRYDTIRDAILTCARKPGQLP